MTLKEMLFAHFNHYTTMTGMLLSKFYGRFKEVVTDVILTLTNCTGDPLVSLDITGNSAQASTPTPAAPIDILSTGDLVTSSDSDWNTAIEYGKTSFVGNAPSELGVDCYRVPINITGKNLFDENDVADILGMGITVTQADGTTTITKTTTGTSYGIEFPEDIAVKPNTNYVVSATANVISGAYTAPYGIRIHFMDTNTYTTFNIAFNSGSNSRVHVCFYIGSPTTTPIEVEISNIQFELGSIATAYELYHTPITYNMYLDAPLRYGDTLDETGLLTRNSAKAILNSTENWLLYNGNYFSDAVDAYSKTNTTPLCTHLYGASQIFIATGTNRLKLFASALPAQVIDVASLKTWLAANPMTVIYTLATPTTESLTMPAQIDTFAGTTIIQLDTTTQPAILEAEYWSTEET